MNFDGDDAGPGRAICAFHVARECKIHTLWSPGAASRSPMGNCGRGAVESCLHGLDPWWVVFQIALWPCRHGRGGARSRSRPGLWPPFAPPCPSTRLHFGALELLLGHGLVSGADLAGEGEAGYGHFACSSREESSQGRARVDPNSGLARVAFVPSGQAQGLNFRGRLLRWGRA